MKEIANFRVALRLKYFLLLILKPFANYLFKFIRFFLRHNKGRNKYIAQYSRYN